MSLVAPTHVSNPRSAWDLYRPILSDLAEVERVLAETLRHPHGAVQLLVSHLEHYRGKRLRPALLLLTARACGAVKAAHHVLGAVVETIHSATLVHDDVLDHASVRRHVSTVNAEWGNRTSILLGDYLFTTAFHLASGVDARACRLIGAATNRVCAGELLQCTEQGNLDLDEDAYLEMIDGKTAALTACCCQLGAIYAEASPHVAAAMERYGRWLGLAFQIADDLLDIVGEERTTGKSLGTDADQQKLTLPVIHLLRSAPGPIVAQARQILLGEANHKRDALRPLLIDHGSQKYAEDRAKDLAAKARLELDCLHPSDARDALHDLARQVVQRAS
jgi:octaprenyl-diphosphate synthase